MVDPDKMPSMSGSSGLASLLLAVTAATCLALATVAAGGPVAAQQDAQLQQSADVRAGTCAEPGDVVALLEPVPSGVPADQGPTVATSVTQVPLAFAELTGEPHIIAVEASGSTGALCATVGGPLAEGGGLASALVGANGQPVGVAWLRELGLEATTVHIFLLADVMDPISASPDPSASPGPDTSPDPSASHEASPAASPASEDGILPEGEIDPGEDIDVDVAH